jgi:hypothetical protein
LLKRWLWSPTLPTCLIWFLFFLLISKNEITAKRVSFPGSLKFRNNR